MEKLLLCIAACQISGTINNKLLILKLYTKNQMAGGVVRNTDIATGIK